MLFTDVIRTKRDGGALDEAQIDALVAGLADDSLPAEQVAALAMAIYLNSMSVDEAGLLTRKMAASGLVIDWSDRDLGGPVVDKHSTGGIGDKVSFLLAPMAAACGCYVPMISGRGLGHSGGTLDKIASVPGYDPLPAPEDFRRIVESVGCAIIGQTKNLAPADRRFYAIRDITATVESVPLITASILSKKMAAGLDALVMDVKYGSGAFMKTVDEAKALAESIIGTGRASGLATHALLTDMNENLGTTAGNAVEIREAVAFLTGGPREARLNEVTLGLVAEMLRLGGIETDRDKAVALADEAVTSGRAAEILGRMLAALGGPADFMERPDDYLPVAPLRLPAASERAGYLAEVDGLRFGNAIIELGGGRRRVDDELDLSVGFSEVVPVGTRLAAGDPLAVVHAADEASARAAVRNLREACTLSEEPPSARPVVREVLSAERAAEI
ncbi:MAG: thymidine phosphorylase [Woeseiaceae bacterium]|nr:thymidine phosphorylase [Woeseiaceae bacterium]